jgi:uncharacterized protein (TIGR03435 family)
VNVFKTILRRAATAALITGPVAAAVITGARLSAQIVAPAADAPTFEVASVKPNNQGGGRIGRGGTPGRMDLMNMTARLLIRQAYNIHDSQIIGGPDWTGSQGFDVNATLAGDAPLERRRLMMQTLLRDRFKLAFHVEKRDMPVYALVTGRSDKKLGSGLIRTPEGACPAPGTAAPGRSGPPGPFDPNGPAPCGALMFGSGRLMARGVTIDNLATALGSLPAVTAFNRIVQNQTGLEGTYDFEFTFANDFAGRGPGGPPLGAGPAPTSNPGDEPALFTALQEQLGLKLDARRATVDVLVIDSMQKPEEN